MTDGPFAPYPADAGQVQQIGGRIARHGSTLASVGETAARQGRIAGTVDSFGLFDDLVAAVQPSALAGTTLQRSGRIADLALSAWAGAIRGYDRRMQALNSEWQAAKADDFGVGGLELDRAALKPAQIEQAVSDHDAEVADARSALLADLVRRQQRARRDLDAAADGVAALLNAGPDALGTALAGVGLSGSVSVGSPGVDATGPTDGDAEEFESLRPGSPDALGAMGNYDGNPVDWMETLAFLLGDPRECVGDDASIGGCGFEVATLFPWFKPLKAAKIAKYAKRADEAGDASKYAPSPRSPVGHRGKQIDIAPGTNGPAVIDGRAYSGHSLDRMQERGFTPTIVDDAIRSNPAIPSANDTYIHYDPENNISVIVNADGRVVTVIPTDRRPRT